VLFPSTTTADTRPARRHSDFVQKPATSSITPKQSLSAAYSPQNYHLQHPHLSGNNFGSSTSSPMQTYSPLGQAQNRFYASSAPNSSTALNNSPRARPPVPMFSQSTGNIKKMATHTHTEGSTAWHDHISLSPQLTSSPSDMSTGFDFEPFASASDVNFDEPLDFGHIAQFEPINHPAPVQTSTHPLTVSPKDVMVDSTSAPPSTTFTDLTTPGTSTFESPYMVNSNQTSPFFGEEDLGDNSDDWPSLFPTLEDNTAQAPVSYNTNANASPAPAHHVAPAMSRNGSSPGQSARSSHQGHGRHSFTSGVASKRRDKPLPAIVADPSDTVAVKRARNTLAARKSRAKRMERTEQLESEVANLEAEVEHWKNIALSRGHVD